MLDIGPVLSVPMSLEFWILGLYSTLIVFEYQVGVKFFFQICTYGFDHTWRDCGHSKIELKKQIL